MLLVGTAGHLTDLDRSYAYVDDAAVGAIAVGAGTGLPPEPGLPPVPPVWALLDQQRIAKLEAFDVDPVAAVRGQKAQSLAATAGDTLLVGLEGGHLATLAPGGTVQRVATFDRLPEREHWSIPDGSSPQLRSIAVSADDRWFVAVHVGGVWRSDDQGGSWHNVVPIEADVHEVATAGTDRVAVAAARGFGWSTDGGDTWQWTTDGLHASYCRAVALTGDSAFVTASTGPRTDDGRLYRTRLGDGDAFAPCGETLPRSFPYNLDTGSVAAAGEEVALGTTDGQVFRSGDGGSTWELALHGIWPVHVVRFA